MHAATKVSAALCHNGPAKYEHDRAAAYATATAVAAAIVDITAGCYTSAHTPHILTCTYIITLIGLSSAPVYICKGQMHAPAPMVDMINISVFLEQ